MKTWTLFLVLFSLTASAEDILLKKEIIAAGSFEVSTFSKGDEYVIKVKRLTKTSPTDMGFYVFLTGAQLCDSKKLGLNTWGGSSSENEVESSIKCKGPSNKEEWAGYVEDLCDEFSESVNIQDTCDELDRNGDLDSEYIIAGS